MFEILKDAAQWSQSKLKLRFIESKLLFWSTNFNCLVKHTWYFMWNWFGFKFFYLLLVNKYIYLFISGRGDRGRQCRCRNYRGGNRSRILRNAVPFMLFSRHTGVRPVRQYDGGLRHHTLTGLHTPFIHLPVTPESRAHTSRLITNQFRYPTRPAGR